MDAEHALDPTYARALGVNIDDLLISQPDTGEQALEITEALVRSGALDVVVVDSVAALVPMMSNSASRKGGAILFFTTLARVRLPIISPPAFRVSTSRPP